jgi:hypothetical protein
MKSFNINVPLWKRSINLFVQTSILVIGIIFIKKIVPIIPDPFEFPGVHQDSTTGLVLLAFSILMYLDTYKNNIKEFVKIIISKFN